MRKNGREFHQLREVHITKDYIKYAEGSALIEIGDTVVICTASIEDNVPPFLKNTGKGWVTAEYSMMPRATKIRTTREVTRGRASGRTYEIQRLIGRSIRSVVDLNILGQRTMWLDCDVVQADGGTRVAAITGSFVAIAEALNVLNTRQEIRSFSLKDSVAAVSVGIVDNHILLDLNYDEDTNALVDMNVIMTGKKRIVEIQGTAEHKPFSREEMDQMMSMAEMGIEILTEKQRAVLGEEIWGKISSSNEEQGQICGI